MALRDRPSCRETSRIGTPSVSTLCRITATRSMGTIPGGCTPPTVLVDAYATDPEVGPFALATVGPFTLATYRPSRPRRSHVGPSFGIRGRLRHHSSEVHGGAVPRRDRVSRRPSCGAVGSAPRGGASCCPRSGAVHVGGKWLRGRSCTAPRTRSRRQSRAGRRRARAPPRRVRGSGGEEGRREPDAQADPRSRHARAWRTRGSRERAPSIL